MVYQTLSQLSLKSLLLFELTWVLGNPIQNQEDIFLNNIL